MFPFDKELLSSPKQIKCQYKVIFNEPRPKLRHDIWTDEDQQHIVLQIYRQLCISALFLKMFYHQT
jgi:hypothetical protein